MRPAVTDMWSVSPCEPHTAAHWPWPLGLAATPVLLLQDLSANCPPLWLKVNAPRTLRGCVALEIPFVFSDIWLMSFPSHSLRVNGCAHFQCFRRYHTTSVYRNRSGFELSALSFGTLTCSTYSRCVFFSMWGTKRGTGLGKGRWRILIKPIPVLGSKLCKSRIHLPMHPCFRPQDLGFSLLIEAWLHI